MKIIEIKANGAVQKEIDDCEEKIATILHDKAKSKNYQFRKFCDKSSSFPVQSMWKMKKKKMPKKKTTLPVAKLSQMKKLVASPMEIKKALYQEYKEGEK